MEYNIFKVGVDFDFLANVSMNTKGTRCKRIARSREGEEEIYFKYESYNCSESCSEKMSFEIAKVLGYSCARIEFGEDEDGRIGVLNYLFVDRQEEVHSDAISYINKDSSKRGEFYTISNIKRCLDEIDENLFNDFLKIMVFDCLVGETDRHEENWGITRSDKGYKLSPLYDNGCNLLRNFKNYSFARKYYDKIRDFNSYIRGGKAVIYKENGLDRYNLFELIEYLYMMYPNIIRKEILNLEKLSDELIEKIVLEVPLKLLTCEHKKFIIKYLKERKRILMSIIK